MRIVVGEPAGARHPKMDWVASVNLDRRGQRRLWVGRVVAEVACSVPASVVRGPGGMPRPQPAQKLDLLAFLVEQVDGRPVRTRWVVLQEVARCRSVGAPQNPARDPIPQQDLAAALDRNFPAHLYPDPPVVLLRDLSDPPAAGIGGSAHSTPPEQAEGPR